MNAIHAVLIELAIAAVLVTAVALSGKAVRSKHYWKADHLYEISAEIGYMAFWGMILSYVFSFNGDNGTYSLISCILFSTFLLPFLGFTWVADWPSPACEAWSTRNSCNAWPGGISFALSMMVLGTAAYFACLNSGQAAYALWWGLGIGGGACLVLLALAVFSEGWVARGA